MKSRKCKNPACRIDLTRKTEEPPKSFNRRKYCDHTCFTVSLRRAPGVPAPDRARSRKCIRCGAPTERRNKYCTRVCANKDRLRESEQRHCKHCNSELTRKAKETNADFVERIYCKRTCLYASKKMYFTVLGVALSAKTIMQIADCVRSVVSDRVARGRCPLTGAR